MKKGVLIIVGILFFILAVGIASSVNNSDNNGKIDEEVNELLNGQDEVSVIVVLEDDYDVLNEYSVSSLNEMDEFEKKKAMVEKQQENVLSDLDLKQEKTLGILEDKNFDFELERKFSTVNAFFGNVTEDGLEKLKNNPNIKKIYPNRPVSAFLNDSKFIVNASKTWSLIYNSTNLTGKNEVVCVLDTGVDYTHPDLGGCANTTNINNGSCAKVIGGYDFVNSDQNPMDDNGHGTHVAGIVASTNETYTGIAPDANIIAIKVLDSNGDGSFANVASGIDWCVDNSSIFNISVITLSLGTKSPTLFTGHCDDSYTTTADAINGAIAKNISVTIAAGNDGSTTKISSPACIRNATSVGAVDKNNAITYNRNNLTDLVATGSNIISLRATGTGTGSCSEVDSNKRKCSGTSMATPIAAASFSLIHQYFKLTENKTVMPNETQRYLNDTGKQIDDTGGSGFYFSRINIFEAIKSLDTGSPRITIIRPANNTAVKNISFLVNISSTEVLANATLEINNTNFTMAGSGLKWNVNISSLINGTYTYRIYGNDTFGNLNISDTFTVNIDMFAPTWSGNQTNITDARKNYGIQFNITWSDSVQLSSFIFSWNHTGLWANITNGSLSGQNQVVSLNQTLTSATNIIGWKFYANDTAGNFNSTDTFTFSVLNTIPTAENLTINSTDFLNRTNGTLQGSFSFVDIDGDSIADNETIWYNNTEQVPELINLTSVSKQNTTKGQIWAFSARVFDGANWSSWVNSSNMTIKNAVPVINITVNNVTVNETQRVNITTNASDIDNDNLTFTINDSSRFSLDGIYFIWNTNLTDSGNFNVNITVNDSENIDSKIVTVSVLDSRDLDNDGNPDFNDTDDDNDGISDGSDFLSGNLSNINTTSSINITINGTANLSKLYNGTFFINITNGTAPIVEFNFTFNENNTLDLGSITFNRTINGTGAVSIRGINLTGMNKTKTVFLEKVNATVDAVCIKDLDIGFDNISSACDASNEVLVNCNNQTTNGYTCFDTGTRYKVTGLNHSAIKELCVDKDGDGYGSGCSLGSDCNDDDSSKNTDCSTSSPSSTSSGGGGGGGGGTLTATSAGTEKIHFYQSLISGQEIKINVNRDAIAFEKTEFTVNKDLEGITITIRLLEEDDAPNTIENAYQYVEVETDGITDNDIGNVKIDFKVNNSWFTDNNFDSDTVVLNRYDDDWKKLSTIKISKTSYEATSPGFSLFAITADKLKQKKIESKITKKAVNETKKTEAKDTDLTGIAVAESKKTIFPVGIAITIVVIISGILTYISILGIGKNRKT
jgi:PGF-pre-PGF domain-containing protein